MAVAFQQDTTYRNTAASTSFPSVTAPSGVTNGQRIVAIVTWYTSSGGTSATSDTLSGFTFVGRARGATTEMASVYYKDSSGSEPATYTATVNVSAQCYISFAVVSGHDPAIPPSDAKFNNGTASTTTVVFPSVTSLRAGALVVGGVQADGPAPSGTSTGRYAERWDLADGFWGGTYSPSSTGAQGTDSWTASASVASYVAAAAVVEAPASNPLFDQHATRFRYDDGDLLGASPVAAANTNATWLVDQNVRLRVLLQSSVAAPTQSTAFALYCSKNGGAYQPVTSVSTVARSAGSQYAPDDVLASQVLGSGSYDPGRFDDGDGQADGYAPLLPMLSQETELEFCFFLRSADLAAGDAVDFRAYQGGLPLATYANTPRLTAATSLSTNAVRPNAIVSQTGFSGAYTDVQADDANWLTGT